jgi:hypothetical protein
VTWALHARRARAGRAGRPGDRRPLEDRPEKAALALIDCGAAHTFGAAAHEGRRSVAISDPLNTAVLEDLRFTTGSDVRGVIAERSAQEGWRLRREPLPTPPKPKLSAAWTRRRPRARRSCGC